MGAFLLSKTTYLYGSQCIKRLWLNRFQPKLKDPLTAEQAERFNKGIDFGILAQSLFAGGIDVSPAQPYLYPQSAERTTHLINIGHSLIYEATFIADEVMCAVDIFVIKEGKAHAFEVKNAISARHEHILDAALQYRVITDAGIEIEDFSIIHRNKDYSLPTDGPPDLQQLFAYTSVLESILPLQDSIKMNIKTFKNVFTLETPPDIAMGDQCEKPYPCNFKGFCSQKNIFNL